MYEIFHIVYYLIISAYSLSLPLLSLHLRNMTDASTLAGEKVLGSLSREITLSRIVLMETEPHRQEMRTTKQIRSCICIKDKLDMGFLKPVTKAEASPCIFPLVAPVHAAPNVLRFSNTDSSLKLSAYQYYFSYQSWTRLTSRPTFIFFYFLGNLLLYSRCRMDSWFGFITVTQ